MSRAHRRVIAFAAVVVVAFLLRAIGLRWGLPNSQHYFSYHPDEVFLLLPSFGFAQGDWNPHFFNYGTLYLYLAGMLAVLLRIVPEVARFPENLGPLYLLARNVSLWMGIGTVALVAFVCWRERRWLGILAALFLAVCPLHVVNSGYATVDVPATFFITLAFVLALRGAERPDARWGAVVGLAVGLAAATKYSAGLFLIPAALAPLVMAPRTWRWSWCLAMVAAAVVGLIAGCPFFWTEEFRRGFLFELHHARVGGTLAFADTGNGWLYHLVHGLPVGLGYPHLAAVIIGIVAAIRGPTRPTRLALLWIVLYLFVIGFGKERFIRYLVPLTPFLCVLAASGLIWLYGLSRHRLARGATVVVGAAAVALAGCYVGWYADTLIRADPRDRVWAEMRGIVVGPLAHYRVGLVAAPWFPDPPVSPYNAGPFSRPMFEVWNRAKGSRVIVTGWDAAKLRSEKPDIFFLSDLESQDLLRLRRPDALSFISALNSLYENHQTFGPVRDMPAWLAPPRSWVPPDWLYQSPVITMYYNPR